MFFSCEMGKTHKKDGIISVKKKKKKNSSKNLEKESVFSGPALVFKAPYLTLLVAALFHHELRKEY